MPISFELDQLGAAHRAARAALLARRDPSGCWSGAPTSGSPLATAAAVCALAAAGRHVDDDATAEGGWLSGVLMRTELNELIVQSLKWLADQQNADGGWGDCDSCKSTLPATMLVDAALHVTGVPAKFAGLPQRAATFVEVNGGVKSLLHEYQDDRALATAVLACRAAADVQPWRKALVPSLLQVCVSTSRRLQGSRYWADCQTPIWLAATLARNAAARSRLPFSGWVRAACRRQILASLGQLQSSDGSFFASIPTTGFVVTLLASAGLADHAIVRNGVEFLLSAVGADASWPTTPNQTVRSNALAVGALGSPAPGGRAEDAAPVDITPSLQLLQRCQFAKPDTRNGVPAGGWSWTCAGGLATVEDASAAVVAVATGLQTQPAEQVERLKRVAIRGVEWILRVQRDDGGWSSPRFEAMRHADLVDGADAAAEAVIALCSARQLLNLAGPGIGDRIESAAQRGCQFLVETQSSDGSWLPSMYGNQHTPGEGNAVYGTARALTALAAGSQEATGAAERGVHWLVGVQHASGGWGPATWPRRKSNAYSKQAPEATARLCSMEETAIAVEALLAVGLGDEKARESAKLGLSWIVESVLSEEELESAAIGRFLGRLWRLDPLLTYVLAVRTLRKANTALTRQATTVSAAH